jgi:TetR/AcrR family transcriptional regulator, transcriptional repressor for nem operon
MTMKPKKRTRNLAETRRAILAAAFSEIHAHGFHASSVDAILEQTGLTKGALFHQFASKLELGYAVVDEVIAPMTHARWVEPLAAFDDPLEGILHQLRANIGDAPQATLNLGCPANNLIQEMANSDREFQRRLRRVIEAWIDGIEAHVRRGQRSGHVRRSVDARAVAEYVVTSHEGVFSIIKALRDKRVLSSLLTSMETFFAAIAPL